MGFSVVLFGTPSGYKYEKIDNSTAETVCPDSMASKFDSFEVNKLGLRPSDKIWVMFKQIMDDGQSVIGLGLYQSAYEYNQDRSGGYYGVGLLLQDVNCSDFEGLKNIIELIFSSTSKVMLKNNKHTDDHYQKLKNQLIASGQFDNLMGKINSLLINSTVSNEDLAELTLSYLYAFNKNISKFFDFLMENKNHFDSFVCFGIDTPETKQSIEQLGNKKLYPTKDLIAQLDREIENGAINAKENRLRGSYQAVINAKKQGEEKLDELSNLLQINTQKIEQLESEIRSLESDIQTIEKNKKLTQEELEGNKDSLARLTSEIKIFEQKTGRELLVAKPKPISSTPEIWQDSLPSPSQNLAFNNWNEGSNSSIKSTRTTSSKHQQGQRPNESTKQTGSNQNDDSNGINIVLISLCVIAIVLIIALVVIWSKESSYNFTQKSESTTNDIQQGSESNPQSATNVTQQGSESNRQSTTNGTQQGSESNPQSTTNGTQQGSESNRQSTTNGTQKDSKTKSESTTNATQKDSKSMSVIKKNTLAHPPTSLK